MTDRPAVPAPGADPVYERLARVLYIAEHLFQMVPQGVWREHGAGMYGGDYHAERVAEELADHRAFVDGRAAS